MKYIFLRNYIRAMKVAGILKKHVMHFFFFFHYGFAMLAAVIPV